MRRGIALVCLTTLLLAGCWDRREVNDVAFVAASALDREGDVYQTSWQVPIPGRAPQGRGAGGGGLGSGGAGGGGGGAQGRAWYLDSAEGRSVREAAEAMQKKLPRQAFFGHRRVLLVGEEAARAGLADAVDVMVRVPQNRLTAYMILTRGPARDVMAAGSPVEQMPAETARELAQGMMQTPPTLQRFLESLLSTGSDPLVPAMEAAQTQPPSGEQAQTVVNLFGAAVFQGDRLTGFLTPKQTQSVLLAMGQARAPTVTVPAPGGKGLVSVQFQETRSKLEPFLQGNRLGMRIVVQLKGSVVENASPHRLAARQNLLRFARELEKQVKEEMEAGVKALQTEYVSDALGFGEAFRRRYPQVWRRVETDWYRHYPGVMVRVEPHVSLQHTSILINTPGRRKGEQQP